jgi:adenosine kinase
MNFPGFYKDHILPEKVHILNVSFLVQSLRRQRGGCAPNIAYNLSLLGESPAILGTVGSDFAEYQTWLNENGIDTRAIKVVPDEFTACCFIMSDKASNQITSFYPGAMASAHELSLADYDFSDLEMAIISPNDPKAMEQYVNECHKYNLPYVFDPGQQTIALTPEQLLAGAKGAKVIIGNDYELELVRSKTGYSPEQLLEFAEMVIITLGENGSQILTRERQVEIPIAHVSDVQDPTGAGDAYRAGIIKGLVRGYSLEEMGRLGALAGAYCVEHHGTMQHRYTPAEFAQRYAESFGSAPSNLAEIRQTTPAVSR